LRELFQKNKKGGVFWDTVYIDFSCNLTSRSDVCRTDFLLKNVTVPSTISLAELLV